MATGNYSVKEYFGGKDTQEYKNYQAGKSSGKYSDLMDYVSKTSGAKPISYSGGSGGGDMNSYIQNATKLAQQAVQPAVGALQTSKSTLQDKYKNLLDTVKNQGDQAINAETLTQRNELGRRGILPNSGLYESTVTGAVNPLRQNIANLLSSTGIAGQQEENNINTQIATMLSNAGLQGLSLGGSQFNTAQTRADQQDQAKSAAEWQKKLYETITLPESQYAIGKPYYSPNSSSNAGGALDLAGLWEKFNAGIK